MDQSGLFKKNTSSSCGNLLCVSKNWESTIVNEISKVNEFADVVVGGLQNTFDDEKGVEVLNYFILDLLGPNTIAAKAFNYRLEESDSRAKKIISWNMKLFVIFLISFLDIFFTV